jgi:hypothetical protein
MCRCMKRTTLVLEDSCMDGVRNLAHQEDRDISAVVNELLRDGLRQRQERKPTHFDLPAHAMGRPRVNVADRETLERAMEGA